MAEVFLEEMLTCVGMNHLPPDDTFTAVTSKVPAYRLKEYTCGLSIYLRSCAPGTQEWLRAGGEKIWNVSSGDLILTANDVYLKSIVFSYHGKVLLLTMMDHGNSEVKNVFACNVAG